MVILVQSRQIFLFSAPQSNHHILSFYLLHCLFNRTQRLPNHQRLGAVHLFDPPSSLCVRQTSFSFAAPPFSPTSDPLFFLVPLHKFTNPGRLYSSFFFSNRDLPLLCHLGESLPVSAGTAFLFYFVFNLPALLLSPSSKGDPIFTCLAQTYTGSSLKIPYR